MNAPEHRHHWVIPAAWEGLPLGRCVKCGATRMFDNDTGPSPTSHWSRARSARGLATRYGRKKEGDT